MLRTIPHAADFPGCSAEEMQLLDLACDAILVRDMNRAITFWNRGAEELYGWAKDEAMGRTVLELLKTEYPGPIEDIEAEVLRSGRWEGEVGHSKRDGSRVIMSSRWVLQRDDHGRPRAILEINNDVTDHARAEEALRARVRQQAAVAELGQSALSGLDLGVLMDEATALVARNLEAEYSHVLELLPDGVALLLRAGTGWGEGFVGHAKLSSVADSPAGCALLARDPVIVNDLRSDARFGGASLLREQGMVSGMSVVIPGSGRPYGALGAFTARGRKFTQDDSYFLQSAANVLALAIERKRHEQEQRERDLLRSDQMVTVGQVAAGVAHELRNPLTSVKGLVQVNLKEASSRGLPTDDLRVIEQEIRRMERTLQAFLDFARPPRPARRRMNLIPLIEQTLALVRGRIEKRKVTLQVLRPPGPVVVEADADQLEQLLLNLALNALDVLPRGGSLEIELRLPHQGWVELWVSDNGPGIAPSLLPRVFEPFVSSKESGLGLGLTVSRRIAQDHGGDLVASNRPEGGACFVLRLPAPPDETRATLEIPRGVSPCPPSW
jgi:PAS domain S-box-containing protein